jgi:hypothetical protein
MKVNEGSEGVKVNTGVSGNGEGVKGDEGNPWEMR